ncbi:hypothetical protein COCON_G00048880 [Conger conger]|uniref:Uncharacterized protein n=1 Tax=Conger conger TaxID=82655 RepID=A0A9Q1DVI3_CONCO|nr:hypothetical protein COCON_G00048880 [Conger conger]
MGILRNGQVESWQHLISGKQVALSILISCPHSRAPSTSIAAPQTPTPRNPPAVLGTSPAWHAASPRN